MISTELTIQNQSIKEYFPKLKTQPGERNYYPGRNNDIEILNTKIIALLEHYHRYNMLTVANLKRIILEDHVVADPEDTESVILYGNAGKAIRARTSNQRKLVELAKTNDLLFATGPAGSGKTYTAIALAVRALRNREVKRIVLSRPAVEAGENLGFLPGDMKEKVDPYLQPLYDALSGHEFRPKSWKNIWNRNYPNSSAGLYERTHVKRLFRNPRRSPEYDPQSVENVFNPNGDQCKICNHR